MKMPWFKFYNFDWINSRTRANLTYAQQGIYILLLAHCWDEPLPTDKKMLSRLCPGAKVTDIEAVITRCFSKDESGLIQERLQDERQKSEVISQERSESAKSRWNKEKQDANAKQMQSNSLENQNQKENQNQNQKEKKELTPPVETKKTRMKKNRVVLPDWIDKQLWLDYERSRVDSGHPLSDTLRVRIITEDLQPAKEAGLDPNTVIGLALKNGWTIGGSIKSLQNQKNNTPKKQPLLSESRPEKFKGWE